LAIVGARADPSLDPWASSSSKAPIKLPGGFGEDFINKPAPQTPSTLARARLLRARAIAAGKLSKIVGELPDAGTSYNPTQESHSALLESAVQEELAKLEAEAKVEAEVAGLGQVVVNRDNGKGMEFEYAEWMSVGPGEVDVGSDAASEIDSEGEEADGVEAGKGSTMPGRKTQAQRNKALRRKLAEQERLAQAAQKRLNASAGSLASFKRAEEARLAAQAEALKIKRQLRAEKEAEALVHMRAGEKVGKYKVPKGDVAVQLGEDLAETLRQIKVGPAVPFLSVCGDIGAAREGQLQGWYADEDSRRAMPSKTGSCRYKRRVSSSLACPSSMSQLPSAFTLLPPSIIMYRVSRREEWR
jgi:nucleolar protein 53